MAYASEIRKRLAAVDIKAEVSAAAADSGFHLNDSATLSDPAAFGVKSKTPYDHTAPFSPLTKSFDMKTTSTKYPLLRYIRQKLINSITQKTGIQ